MCVCQLNHRNSWGQIIRTIAPFDTLTATSYYSFFMSLIYMNKYIIQLSLVYVLPKGKFFLWRMDDALVGTILEGHL